MKDQLEYMSNNQLRELQLSIDAIVMSRLQGRPSAELVCMKRAQFLKLPELRQSQVVGMHYAKMASYAGLVDYAHRLAPGRPEVSPQFGEMALRFMRDTAGVFMEDFGGIPPWFRVDQTIISKTDAS
jgi:hypothetical protein